MPVIHLKKFLGTRLQLKCCLILVIIMHHTFSTGDRYGMQTGQSITCTLEMGCVDLLDVYEP